MYSMTSPFSSKEIEVGDMVVVYENTPVFRDAKCDERLGYLRTVHPSCSGIVIQHTSYSMLKVLFGACKYAHVSSTYVLSQENISLCESDKVRNELCSYFDFIYSDAPDNQIQMFDETSYRNSKVSIKFNKSKWGFDLSTDEHTYDKICNYHITNNANLPELNEYFSAIRSVNYFMFNISYKDSLDVESE